MEHTARTWVCPDCGVAMTEQPRDPRGVPTGGQFATGQRSEAGVSLKPLDGSFLFPPPMRNAAEVIDFWTRVEIPDEALARAQSVYRANREMLMNEWHHHAWSWGPGGAWEDQHPYPGNDNPGVLADWDRDAAAAQAAYEDGIRQRLQNLPETLPRSDVRPLFRASAMLRTCADENLAPEDYQAVANHLLDFQGGPRTVVDAAVETGLVGIAHRFVHADNYDPDGDGIIDPPQTPSHAMSADFDWERHRAIVNEAVQRAIEDQNTKLDAAFDGIWEGIQTNAQITLDANGIPERKRRWSER